MTKIWHNAHFAWTISLWILIKKKKKKKTEQISRKLLSAICVAKIYIIYGGKNIILEMISHVIIIYFCKYIIMVKMESNGFII